MVYNVHWSERASCLNDDTESYFDGYESGDRSQVDAKCMSCPIQRECLTLGVSRREWGVWGGIYLEDGQISEQFNDHRTSEDWGDLWLRLTTLIQ
jgi:hypothetical protein